MANKYWVPIKKFTFIGLEKRIKQSWYFKKSQTKRSEIHCFDTFEGTLSLNHLQLTSQGGKLFLSDGQSIMSGNLPKRTGSFLAVDLEDSPLKSFLMEQTAKRAFLLNYSFDVKETIYELKNQDDKTTVCLYVRQYYKSTAYRSSFTTFWIKSLKGYKKEFTRLRKALKSWDYKTVTASEFINLFHSSLELLPFNYNPKPCFSFSKNLTARVATTQIIDTIIEHVRPNEDGIIADYDIEFLHDYRVNIRKIRSVLSLFKYVYPNQETQKLKHLFGKIARDTNLLRDLDVYLYSKNEYVNRVPIYMRDHLNQLFQHYDQLRKREQKRIRRRFLSKTYANDWDHIRRILSTTDRMLESDNANLNIHSFAGKQLAKRYKRIVKDSQTITASSPSDHIHKLRIQCKKFRYLFDFFQAIFPAKEQQEIIVTLKSLQDKLGRFNDICMQQQSLKDYVKENPEASADLILALGALLGDLSKEELAIRDLLASEISSFVNPQVDKIIKTYTKLKTK